MDIKLEKKECDCYTDTLTGLHNKMALLKYLQSGHDYTLFILDIDNFSNINNTYGYTIGDYLLVNIAEHLKNFHLFEGKLFRFDGDKFVYLTDKPLKLIEMEELAQSITCFFNHIELYADDDIVIKISLSIGVYAGKSTDLLNYASLALNDARRYKKNSFKVFDLNSSYIQSQLQSADWITNIRQYIEDEKFVLFYQPIYDNRNGEIAKYECLIRVAYGSTFITPDNFMYACKATGSLELITKFVIKTAFQEFQHNKHTFSINITSDDINLGYLEKLLMKKCQKYNIKPTRVILEILEDIATLTEPHMMSQINSLRAKGFKIALDDFGVENSNFARLLDFQPEYIKIDGMFIKNLATSKKSQIIVRTIVDFCKLSGIEVVAEYVHDQAVSDKVKEYGIEYSQGYHIGKPMQTLLN
ncbi:MAG: bifunctional diguanylate cyclase/phosphodiesterase [Sulfurimonas sp.]